MGASSSGLLDEAKITNIKGLVDSMFQSFRVFYRQQYSAAYFGHLHQEVEPKKEGTGLLLTPGPLHAPQEVLYQGCVKFLCWDEHGKKSRERYIILRRDYKVEIYENMENFNRGCAAKLVFHPAGGRVFTTEKESRTYLEQTCAGILNEVKEDSSSVVSSPDGFAVYLHLPYTGHTCFLFQQEKERDHFLSALKTCVRHCNLDPWCDLSYESQAYIRTLQLYRRDKECYESWEMLLGTEENVLASQAMDEVLPWLQSQLQSRVKGKKAERIRQWLATVQETYTLVLEQLTASLEALRNECRETASANQALIRSDLYQIMSSQCFLEEKVRVCVCEEAERQCSGSIAPYMSSILEALAENISAGIQGMRRTLHTHMDSALPHTNGGTEETQKALSSLRSICLDQCYRQVENLTERLEGLKQRFGLRSTQRLVHLVHLEMEKLLDSAVYTLELFLQSSAKPQPSQAPVRMERAKERVLKQLDYDSRVVQKRLYQEALLEITLPALTRSTDSKWKTDMQQFEQHIFSDYSSFILVHNVYDDILRNILSKEIERAVQDAASKCNNLLLDTSDLALSQYSLLEPTPPRSAPDSPAIHPRDSSSAALSEKLAPAVEEGGQNPNPGLHTDVKPDPSATALLSPVIIVTHEFVESSSKEASCFQEDTPSTTADSNSATPDPDAGQEVSTTDSTNPLPDSPHGLVPTVFTPESTLVPVESEESENSTTTASDAGQEVGTTDEPANSDLASPIEDSPNVSVPTMSPPESTDVPVVIESASENSAPPDSDAGQEVGTTDEPANSESTNPIQDSLNGSESLGSTPPSTDVPVVQSTSENSDQVTEDAASVQPPCPPSSCPPSSCPPSSCPPSSCPPSSCPPSSCPPSSCPQSSCPPSSCPPSSCPQSSCLPSSCPPSSCPTSSCPPCSNNTLMISLGSLSEAISCNSTEASVMQAVAQQTTDRAVYLTGEIKDSWEEEREKKAAEEERDDSSESPAESATTSATKQTACEEQVDDEREGSEVGTEETREEKEAEELGSVAVIRGLVTEVTEVETVISPCPSNTP